MWQLETGSPYLEKLVKGPDKSSETSSMIPCHWRVAIGGCLIMLSLSGCAGPMSPFGAINVWFKRTLNVGGNGSAEGWDGKSARVRFVPTHQVLHGAFDFAIEIDDPAGVPLNFYLKLIYNGVDSSSRFLERADRLYLDSEHKRLRLSISHVRVLPSRENKIVVVYRRSDNSQDVVAKFEPPRCSAFAQAREIASVPEFQPPAEILRKINEQSALHGLNPYYVAGLIAQESGFDPLAVSRARALGLTQVTSQGEAEVIRRNSDWPRYPGLDEMSLPWLRFEILEGAVNASNEWRLNPTLSIQGGVEYLIYLSQYWSRPEKRAMVTRNFGSDESALSELMLASYNSGAMRVSQAVEERGSKYLQDEDLVEARKYVGRVVSYCDYFANLEH